MNPFGDIGVWRSRNVPLDGRFAARVEGFGYSTLWIGSSPDGDLDPAMELLDATESLVVGTSIANIWKTDPEVAARAYHRLEAAHPGASTSVSAQGTARPRPNGCDPSLPSSPISTGWTPRACRSIGV